MTKDEALKLALEALESLYNDSELMVTHRQHKSMKNAITAIREALAQPEQEPNKDGSPCSEFWDWLPKAYNFEGDGNFTKYNMEVAFLAGKQAAQPEQEPVAVVSGYYGGQCVILPIDPARIFNSNTALYTSPPQPEQNQFNPDWDAMAVMVEEQQRMAKRIAELEAQQQAPVAWLHTKIEDVAVPHRPADLDKHPDRWEALYKTPPPCPTCEALARTVMLDQTCHDAQRKPLTDEELRVIENKINPNMRWRSSDEEGITLYPIEYYELVRAIEAAHGIKE